MPLVAHTDLPTFNRLRQEGQNVLSPERATHQHIRELHIGLLNMMPDSAIEATERQFFRLVGEANPIAQFFLHPFTLEELPRGEKAKAHIDAYYETFDQLKRDGLDALIITGANVTHPDLAQEAFWKPLTEVVDWAYDNVTSVLCSCLATHAVVQSHHGQKRTHMGDKLWGVYSHRVIDPKHPLVNDVNTRFDVPHSRFNQITTGQFQQADLKVLVESVEAGVHLAVSKDGLRVVYFQGHPEYDTISLLKEYKREVTLYFYGQRIDYPPFPENYFSLRNQAIFNEYRERLELAKSSQATMPEFPEDLVIDALDNTWHDTAEAVIGNWIGLVYQITHHIRNIPFMEGVDPDNPLGLE
ncbi:MAG: homoserine O-succinyltransferase [gamma proteobacterium symbiont of Ctena orbiculata]|uniref:Homoserine O-succinyltransferase n=1 Tax=Candidatus Thiodiazotropha taylori TaxID=2792791 RepID=A0A944MAV3_9GAMM|nr:homoserine O-succinyltransferase [Candidatus Thiodiazotropha taylori]PUB88517.1 MAG: homoserine O-succinyltransferase [gamma proteobacterium symbiont of Ctena orbiculata]MBT2991151.1 homoserine O-succinyltransferase [Candidatus Thiodiazotropha taylori]MBT2998911.1 homoserine O-succinyltransferase [Candidatus Thiodiazotropha taylori]MBT3002859.1 homoserine O-succinyltransferase [Candidatus Thiodiazotropha taylori]